jgi:hypothetical protein
MSRTAITVALMAALPILAHSASAEAGWTHTTTFRFSRSTSIRVVEPQGFTVSVKERKDSIPAVFNLPKENAYEWVTITAKDGKVWRKKIEVRANNETVLTVSYTADDKPAPKAGPGRKYIGSIANTSHRCKRSDNTAYRFDFLLDGQKLHSVALNPNKFAPNVELTGGSYDVRVFKYTRRQYVYKTTLKRQIDRDGWRVSFGCGR